VPNKPTLFYKLASSLIARYTRETRGRPDAWDDFWYESSRRASSSSVNVTQDVALSCSAVYACVRVLSETVAQPPLILYRRDGEDRDRASGHPLYWLLHDAPNPEMSAFQWRETMTAHLCLRGNHYSQIDRDRANRVKALWPLAPDRMTPKRPEPGGPLLYEYKTDNGGKRVYQPSEILHVRGMSLDGIIGLSPIAVARDVIGAAVATHEYGARYFANSALPPGILTPETHLTTEQMKELRESWERTQGGLGNVHRIAVSPPNMKFQSLSITPEDSQFIETMKFRITDIARIFGVPPHKIADFERATFCLPAETLIATDRGAVPIAEVMTADRVWSLIDDALVLSPVTRSGQTGVESMLTLKTQNRTISCTANHPILTRRRIQTNLPADSTRRRYRWEHGWIPAGELAIGDVIVTLGSLPESGGDSCPTRTVTEGFAEFCGLLLGDGWIGPGCVSIARASTANYIDHYRQVVRDEFTGRAGDVFLQELERMTRFSSVKAATELRELGLGGKAHTKSVPAWVFCLSPNLRLAFLRGFLDADGSVDLKGRASFSSCNEILLRQIRELCMGLGIPVTNMRLSCGKTRLPNGRICAFEQWSFLCSDPGANRRIGSHDARYVDRMARGVPFCEGKLRTYYAYADRTGKVPIQPPAGCGHAKIVSIERGEEAVPVYDISVEDGHSFIAEGVIVHNSNITETNREWIKTGMMPWWIRIESEINRTLLSDRQQGEYFCEHMIDGLLRGDQTQRFTAYASATQWGHLTRNEIRRMENMPPLGEEGDRVWVPTNMMPLPKPGEEMPKPAPAAPPAANVPEEVPADATVAVDEKTQAAARAFLPAFADVIARVIRREKADVMASARHLLKRGKAEEFDAWLDDFGAQHEAWSREQVDPLLRSFYLSLIGASGAGAAGIGSLVDSRSSAFGRGRAERMASVREWAHAAGGDVSAFEARMNNGGGEDPGAMALDLIASGYELVRPLIGGDRAH
jgi:HK97 family phage portal protein